jgi:purine-binding chemotaxis protein CheW
VITVADTKQFCTFYLDKFLFGVEVRKVQEVIRHLELTRVPLAPPVISGLINLRGRIVTAVDLRRRLELPPRPEGFQPMNVVIDAGEEAVSLLVDTIGAVLTVQEDSFEKPPETLTGVARDLIFGAYKLKDRLLLALDIDKAIQGAMS